MSPGVVSVSHVLLREGGGGDSFLHNPTEFLPQSFHSFWQQEANPPPPTPFLRSPPRTPRQLQLPLSGHTDSLCRAVLPSPSPGGLVPSLLPALGLFLGQKVI